MKVSVAALALEELQLAAEFYASRGGSELGLAFVLDKAKLIYIGLILRRLRRSTDSSVMEMRCC